ncbi:MAG: hypothetical protein RIM23_14550 [Coleofasciculus sp. G3-WIS-01]|uniref:hypothetical protein n=1 Tax=Coleofasciculus sp. G3-WIS-01 TaxID=3069528 RepID=UPI003302B046
MAHSKLIGKLSLTTALATLIAVLSSPAAQAIVLDFNELPKTLGLGDFDTVRIKNGVSDFESKGFLFDASDEPNPQNRIPGFTLVKDRFEAHNGTPYIVIEDYVPRNGSVILNPVTISKKDKTAFSLLSLDIAKWSTKDNQAQEVEIKGCLFGKNCDEEGGFVFHKLDLTIEPDGSGSKNDFQTVGSETFDEGWKNLISVTFKGFGATDNSSKSFALDNIQIKDAVQHEEIPEGNFVLSLLAFGFVGVGSLFQSKQ